MNSRIIVKNPSINIRGFRSLTPGRFCRFGRSRSAFAYGNRRLHKSLVERWRGHRALAFHPPGRTKGAFPAFPVMFILVVSIIALVSSVAVAHDPTQIENVPVPPVDVNVPSMPLDVPDTLVPAGVTSYDMAVPKIFWYTKPPCIPARGPSSAMAIYAESISRIATYGSMTRTLYYQDVNPSCPSQTLDVRSNILADDDYVYWMSTSLGGVARLSTDANIGDAPELLSDAVSGNAELAQDNDYVYVLPTSGSLMRISKTNGSAFTRVSDPGTSPRNLQADGKFVYWITGGDLKRISRTGSPAIIATIASNVTGYYPEGRKLSHCIIGQGCYYTEYVFIGQGDDVIRYNNLDQYSTTIYTSSDSSAVVYSLVTDYVGLFSPSRVFFFESREFNCDPFCDYQDVLFRTGRSGGTADALYQTVSTLPEAQVADDLTTDNTLLFWEESGALQRLPNDAAALPQINLDASSLEITQGIQNTYNSVRLIENRRTFVRVYADSDGDPVPGVTAYLYRTNSSYDVLEGPLVPINPVGMQITVPSWSNRTKINDSFLFELPWSWTQGTLYLRAEVNPNRFPLEPNYGDNVVTDGPFTFDTSPRLQVQFVSFGYVLNNQIYYPRLIDDVFQAYSWIRRAYPLASTPGSASDPSPGFRPNLWIVGDDALGGQVFVDPNCTDAMKEDTATFPHCSNLRASAYTNSLMRAMRVENGIPDNVFMYGMISDASGHFPRGQAGSGNVSSGPAGVYCCGSSGWDFDGSYADWYAAHEIGHTLARGHPAVNADDPNTEDVREGCGHSPDDPSYPYPLAKISYGNAYGFDGGDPALNSKLQMAVYPGIFWYDVMSYCPNEWISDYTYNAMYDYIMAHPSAKLGVASPTSPRVDGDFLSVFGEVMPDGDTATFHRLRRVSSVAGIPELVSGDDDYRIRLLDAGDAVLADYDFTPEPVYNSNEPTLSFGQVVTFATGTAQVQIIRGVSEQVLVSQTLSANPPTISNVALPGAPNPVTGTVTLAWTASDPDDDPLSFDVLYSADGGAFFQPIQAGVISDSTEIDTAQLAGSTNAILRVVATDGVHTAEDETAPFTMGNKPPQPRILSPADGTQIHYGQLLNFSGEALDAQDGSVSGAGLVWNSQHGQLGTGPMLSIDDLPVGINQITLSATNSVGLSAYTTISVTVDDDLDLPGPTLSVGPKQVGWHVSVGTTETQTAEIGISNAGDGSLDWLASEDADWLTISAVTGTVPHTLTLTADPSGMFGGAVLTTTLWITSPASTDHVTETIPIPVGLMVGDVYFHQGGHYLVYLPVVLRDL